MAVYRTAFRMRRGGFVAFKGAASIPIGRDSTRVTRAQIKRTEGR